MKKSEIYLDPLLNFYDIERPVNWKKVFGNEAQKLTVEIGFGMGEVLLRAAEENPLVNYVGIEQHTERIYKTLSGITRKRQADPDALRNIKILSTDARVVFERYFTESSIDHIYCLFPCPWPKKSHVKYRLFNLEFLQLLNNRLKNDAVLYIVTDFYPYYIWLLDEAKESGFQSRTGKIMPQFGTKFEKKWVAGGQTDFFEITLQKKEHKQSLVKEDVDLKSFVLKSFDPSNFFFKDITGEYAFICKDMIFDQKQQRLLVYLMVSEPGMTQRFWVEISRRGEAWRVFKMEGQNFLPTEGIRRAIEKVYEAAANEPEEDICR